MKTLLILIIFCLSIACSQNSNVDTNDLRQNPEPVDKTAADFQGLKKSKTSIRDNLVTKEDCLKISTTNRKILKSQTFPIDFAPFTGTCFVTTYDSEDENQPIGSVIALYKGDEIIHKFDTRFNPDTATCWVEAVAFQDLDQDNFKDIIVIGKCGTKSGDILANEVFINDGKSGFTTNVSANDRLENFNTVEEISEFVKKNKELFGK